MRAALCVDQLRGDAHATASLAHRAFEHIADAQLAADLFHIDGLALVRKARIAGDDEEPADAGKRSDDLLDHAVGEIFLLRVAAHIRKGQHCNRRLVGQRQRQGWCLCRLLQDHAVDPQRSGDVLQTLLADICELRIDLAAHLAERVFRDTDAAGLGDALEPRRDIDAVTVDVSVLDDDVAEVDADPEGDPLFLECPGIAFGHSSLYGNRASDGFDHARELDQNAVAGGLNDAAAVLGDLGIDQCGAMRLEPREGIFLVGAHEPAVTRHVRGENGGQPAFEPLPAHRYGNPAARQASTRGSASTAGTAKPAQCCSIIKFG